MPDQGCIFILDQGRINWWILLNQFKYMKNVSFTIFLFLPCYPSFCLLEVQPLDTTSDKRDFTALWTYKCTLTQCILLTNHILFLNWKIFHIFNSIANSIRLIFHKCVWFTNMNAHVVRFVYGFTYLWIASTYSNLKRKLGA